MQLSEPIGMLDVVELRNGRHGTVLEIYDAGSAFLVEISNVHGQALDLPIVHLPDIVRVIWKPGQTNE